MIRLAELVQLSSAALLLLLGAQRTVRRASESLRSLSRNKRGVIALEAAIMTPVFLMFTVGLFDVGMFSVQLNAVQAGLQAGGNYAMQHDSPAASTIISVVKAASPLLTKATVTATPSGGNWTINASVPYGGVAFNGIFNFTTVGSSYTVPQHTGS